MITGTMRSRAVIPLLAVLAIMLVSVFARSQDASSQQRREKAYAQTSASRNADSPEMVQPSAGTGKMLQGLRPEDIEKMELFRLRTDGQGSPRRSRVLSLDKALFPAVISLCKTATENGRAGHFDPSPANHALEVRTTDGRTFEVQYNSGFHEPFGGLYSRQLKETLFALTRGGVCTVIHLDEGNVQRSWRCDVSFALEHHSGAGYETSLDIDPEGRIVLNLNLHQKGVSFLQVRQPMRYGEAKTFPHKGPGHMIVLFEHPWGEPE